MAEQIDEVQQAVELALIKRDIDDLKEGQERTNEKLKDLATTEDVKALKEQLDLLMPWAQTLQSLEKLSKWLTAIAAGIAVLVTAFTWFRGGGSGG